jgi:hypothetical protein
MFKSPIKSALSATNGTKQKVSEATDFEVIFSQYYAKYILAFKIYLA